MNNSTKNTIASTETPFCHGCDYHDINPILRKSVSEPHRSILVYSEDDVHDFHISLSTYMVNTFSDQIIASSRGLYCGNPTLNIVSLLQKNTELIDNASDFIYSAQENQNMVIMLIQDPSIKDNFDPNLFALTNGATFVAQEFSNRKEKLSSTIIKAINHPGLSFVNIIHPCQEEAHKKMPITKIDEASEALTRDRAVDLLEVSHERVILTGVIYSVTQKI